MTDATGNTVWSTTYLPFGEAQRVLVDNVDNLYRFADMEYDSESGVYNTLFRKYSPNLARWLGADPLAGSIDNPQSLNRYGYVVNNPTNFVDPLGLQSEAEFVLEPFEPGKVQNTERFMERMSYYLTTNNWWHGTAGNPLAWIYTPVNPIMPPITSRWGLVSHGPEGDRTWYWDWVPVASGPGNRGPGLMVLDDLVNSMLRTTGDFSAGAGDLLSFGGTEYIRKRMGTNDVVDLNSGAYLCGLVTGLGIDGALGALLTGGAVAGLETKVGIHSGHHFFESVGRAVPHVQVNWFLKGVKGSDNVIRIPLILP